MSSLYFLTGCTTHLIYTEGTVYKLLNKSTSLTISRPLGHSLSGVLLNLKHLIIH